MRRDAREGVGGSHGIASATIRASLAEFESFPQAALDRNFARGISVRLSAKKLFVAESVVRFAGRPATFGVTVGYNY